MSNIWQFYDSCMSLYCDSIICKSCKFTEVCGANYFFHTMSANIFLQNITRYGQNMNAKNANILIYCKIALYI